MSLMVLGPSLNSGYRVEIGTEEINGMPLGDVISKVAKIQAQYPDREVWYDGDRKVIRSRPVVKEDY